MSKIIWKNPDGWLEQWRQKAENNFMRLVVVSNRLPFTVSFHEGTPQFKASAGGLTTGLWSYLDRKTLDGTDRPDFLWMGWPGASVPPEHEAAVQAYGERQFKSSAVFLPEESMDRFYLGFCNKTIWPLFHYFPTLTSYEEENWQEYRNINRRFGEAVVKALRPDDVLWIHDYHLMLLPGLVREKFPEMPIGFFLHIPFPSWEIFRMLPRAVARGDSGRPAGFEPDRVSHARLCAGFSDLGAAHVGL